MSAFSKSARGFSCLLVLWGCGENAAPAASTGGTSSAGGPAATEGSSNVSGGGGSSTLLGGAASSGANSGGAGTTGGGAAAAGGSGGVAVNEGGAAGSASGGASSAGAGTAGSAGAPAACSLAHEKGVAELTLTSGGLLRKVRLFVPSAYDGTKRLPLMLNLHGSSDNADNWAKSSQMEQVAESEGFVVGGLEAVSGQWNVPPADGMPDDVKYAGDAIDLVDKSLCIDLTRVYVSGFSGGGRMSSRLGCLMPDRITAIGPVAGVRWPAPCAGRAVPVIAIHGLADNTNQYVGEGPDHPRWNESVEDAVLGWATKNGCNLAKQVDDPTGPLSTYTYGGCQDGATVKLIRMDGVDHGYPTGTPLHSAKELWSFFKDFSRH
jgi:polyhydroxybutyrate depolymerase